jgi:exocyst complex component 2
MSVVDQLDQTLFDDFIKPKVTVATGKLRGGILDPKMDWYETPQPTGERCSSAVLCNFFPSRALTAGLKRSTVEIRPYMFDTLLYLVGVHAQVNEVAPPLLDRTLNALVESLVEEALRCFKQVKRFGMGGMLRVGLF